MLIDLATSSFGQSFTVTATQMVAGIFLSDQWRELL